MPARERTEIFYKTDEDDLDDNGEATLKPAIRFTYLREARAICDGCPVQAECITHALLTLEDNGIWGGLVPDQRKRLRRYLRAHNLHASPALVRELLAGWLKLSKSQQNKTIPPRRTLVKHYG